MAEVIRRGAAAQEIIADVTATRENAKLRGSPWDDLAGQFLDDVLGMTRRVNAALASATEEHERADKVLALAVREAHLQVGGYYYELWQALRRPAYDLHLRLMFPEGAKSCTDCPVEDQSDRMLLLATLLAEHTHPRLDPARCDTIADELRRLAARLRAARADTMAPRSRVEHYAALIRPVAIVAHTKLSALKKALLAHGFRQTEIHEVIPAHTYPRPKKKGNKAPPDRATEASGEEMPADGEPTEEAPIDGPSVDDAPAGGPGEPSPSASEPGEPEPNSLV